MLNGYDISPVDQPNIDTSRVPGDFVIVQQSFGDYEHPGWNDYVDAAIRAGKKVGIYHFVTGTEGELENYIAAVEPYIGRAVLALDWESGDNSQWGNWNYIESLIQEVIDRTGVIPLLYTMASEYGNAQAVSKKLNCGLWIAQYPYYAPTGYNESPWNESAYNMAMFQYASTGRLDGYDGDLDLDLFYGGRETWDDYAKSKRTQTTEVKHSTPRRNAIMTVSEDAVKQFQNTLPAGEKIVICNTASENMYLTSHDGGLIMTDTPMPWTVQKNFDFTISLADPWGNWITVPENVKNGDLPSVVKGNGSPEQRWVAEPYQGGVKLTSYVNAAMDLDLPDDIDDNGQKVQVWGEWSNDEYCPNQTWKYKVYREEEKTPSEGHTIAKIKETADKKEVKETEKTARTEDERTQKIIGDVADTIEHDINNGTVITDADAVADKMSGMIEEALGKKALSRKTVRWVFIIAILITLACIILSALALSHCLPMWVAGLCAMIIGGTGIGGHALGISATTK